MTEDTDRTTVGQLPDATRSPPRLPAVLTWLVWLVWLLSLGAVGARLAAGDGWTPAGLLVVDGLTVLLWAVVSFFAGIVHSYSRRYMAGSEHLTRFFSRLFGFTLAVLLLVAADHVLLFGVAWLVMGLVMADLVGTVKGWPQARAAAAYTRRYFLASSFLLGVALAVLVWGTGASTVSGTTAAVDSLSAPVWVVAATALLLAAMVQSALVPFQSWLLASMTAPTPASALMHAGFVNAGGILLLRFAPVVTADSRFMLVVVAVGALSALLGTLLEAVQTDVKGELACSTTGQMGFMILQAGLGFFGAAITHLVLHGFYKASLFLGSGSAVEQTTPGGSTPDPPGVAASLLTVLTAAAGGVLFALLTGKGTAVDSGLLLTGLVVVTTLHATGSVARRCSVPSPVRYVALPAVFLAAIAVYAAVYTAVTGLLADDLLVTVPTDLTIIHVGVAAAFVCAYVAVETGVYRRSRRLYVLLLNATQPPARTLTTTTEEYSES